MKSVVVAFIVFVLPIAVVAEDKASESSAQAEEKAIDSTDNTPGTKPRDRGERAWRITLSSYYSAANSIKGKGTANAAFTSPATNEALDAEIDIETSGAPGVAFGVEGFFNPRLSLEGGFAYEFSRQVDRVQADGRNATGGQYTFTGQYNVTHPEINIPFVFANGRYYMVSKFYFLAGLNISFMKFRNTDMQTDPWWGYQVGAGYTFNDRLGLEAQYRRVAAQGKHNLTFNGGTAAVEYDVLELTGAVLALRLSF